MGYSMSQMLWVCALYMMDSLCSHMVLGFYLFAVLDEKLCWKKMGKFVLLAFYSDCFFYSDVCGIPAVEPGFMEGILPGWD